jgi:hypothetical protein
MLSVTCGGCGATFYVSQELAGQEAKCGACGRGVPVPAMEEGAGGAIKAVEGAWEYLAVADRGRLGHVDQAKLNEIGTQGWELVTVFRESPETHTMYFFKRPLGMSNKTLSK